MSNFVASITLQFRDMFSAGVQQAKSSFAGMKQSVDQISNNPMLKLSSDLAMATQMTEPLRRSLQQALEKPSLVASSLQTAMGGVHSVLTESNAIGGNVVVTYSKMELAALNWAAGISKGSDLASVKAHQFADASYSMLSAGLAANEAIAGTARSLILAKATKGENVVAGNLLAVMYNNMGNKAANVTAEMTRLSDIVAQTQGVFQIADLGQLNEGLKYGIPVAKQYGMSIEQLSAIIGQLNSAGLQGSMAGTALNSTMSKMINASKSLDFKIAYDPAGGVDLISTLGNIQKKYGPITGLSNDLKLSFAKAFGEEGMRGVTLLSGSLSALQKNYQAVANSQGAAETMAARISDTYADKVIRAANLTEVWQAKIGKSSNAIQGFFLDIKTGFLRGITPLLNTPAGSVLAGIAAGTGLVANKFLSLTSSGLQVASQLALISSTAASAGGYLNLLKNTAGLLKAPFTMLASGGKAVIGSIASLGGRIIASLPAMGGWIASMWSAAAAQLAAAWPIIAIVAGVAALTAGVVLLIKNWDKVGPWFKNLFSGIANFFKKVWTGIVNFGKMVWNGYLNYLKGVANFIIAPFKFAFTFIKNLVTGNFDGIKQQLSGLITSIKNGIGKLLKPFTAVKDFVTNLFGGKKKAGQKMVSEMAEGIQTENSLYRATEQSFNQVDRLIPHSNAKEGPFSRLTDAGQAIPDTMARGARQTTTLKQILTEAFSIAINTNMNARDNSQSQPSIIIKELKLDCKDIKSLLDFIRMLKQELGFEV